MTVAPSSCFSTTSFPQGPNLLPSDTGWGQSSASMAPQGDWERGQLKGKLMSTKLIAMSGIKGLFTTRYYQLKSIYFPP